MVEERLTLEPEVQQIFEAIDAEKNFLLSGGAGSGKTYSLVSVIRQVIAENPSCRVACMTYTNAAVKEIEERVNHSNLNVTTIHDFLWDTIKNFRKELKATVIHLANDENENKVKFPDMESVPEDYYTSRNLEIQYKEYSRLKEAIISHDEVIAVAKHLFETYPKLCGIVKDTFRYIFIDEYQDTHPNVVTSFLEHFKQSKKPCIVGFFGDSMQSIYDGTVENLQNYVESGDVVEIQKTQNRRCPQQVIDLANKIRTDGLVQAPSGDATAPNMVDGTVKKGEILFLYSNNDASVARNYLRDVKGWNFSKTNNTKELNLTHNLIAAKAGFPTLYKIYDGDKILSFRDRIKKYIKDNNIEEDFTEFTFGDVVSFLQEGKTGRDLNRVSPTAGMQEYIEENTQLYEDALNINYSLFRSMYVDKSLLVDDKKQEEQEESRKGSNRGVIIRHLFKIQTNIFLYLNKRYNEFLRKVDYGINIRSIADKRELKKNISELVDVGEKTVGEIIDDANEKGICLKDDKFIEYISKKEYLYNRVAKVPYSEFQKLYEYLEGRTTFSTQHKTKGNEFDNVFVILDNGRWNNYNFEKLFGEDDGSTTLRRAQKIFYVCCTRSKDNLAVYFQNPSEQVLAKSKVWFGDGNVIPL